ncbi:hypothetical protein [Salinisphaera shabanensis]|uniref:hypothetical protein n=1 Tax=Salinisphaera shabanensis TaxID=180542 RepID=UPI003340FEED
MNFRILAITCVLLGFAGSAFAERAISGTERAVGSSERAISGSERAIGGSENGTSGSGTMSVIDSGDTRTNLGTSNGTTTRYSNGVTNSPGVSGSGLDTRRSQFESDSRPLSDKIEQRRKAFEGSSN